VATHLRKGGRVAIVARSGKRKKILARARVKRNGGFTAKPRLRLRGKVVRVQAVVRGERSRAVRLRLRG
jgi:hypothetical protein